MNQGNLPIAKSTGSADMTGLPMLLDDGDQYIYGAAGRVSQIDGAGTRCPVMASQKL